MNIILYIKTHNKTGLKYFGKTTRKNPEKYIGSGLYWKRHIKKYGNDVTTYILGIFDNEGLCSDFATKFSIENDIVNSKNWANLIIENGLDGAPLGHKGHKFTDEQINNMSNLLKERWSNNDYKNKLSNIHKKRWTNDLKDNQSKRLTGRKRPEHSKIMSGRKLSEETKMKMRKPKNPEQGIKISKALKGKPKSAEHINKLSIPKRRLCRLMDKKEMSINHYTRWLNKMILLQEICV